MDKNLDAIEMSRKLRQRVSKKILQMTSGERIAHFSKFSSMDVLVKGLHQKKHLPKAA